VADIEKLAGTLDKIGKHHKEIAAAYETIEDIQLNGFFKQLGECFIQQQTRVLGLAEQVSENLEGVHCFLNGKQRVIAETMAELQQKFDAWQRAVTELKNAKETLWSAKKISDWKLSPQCTHPLNVLVQNKAVAFPEILPDQTARVLRIRETYSYFLNKAHEEVARMSTNDCELLARHLTLFAHRHQQQFNDLRCRT
jgi:prefoldin subunit 5